jgi:hypothetical protein
MQTKIGTLKLIETKEWTPIARRLDDTITSRLEPDYNNVSVQPIIICDDEIKVDDYFWSKCDNFIDKCLKINNTEITGKKVVIAIGLSKDSNYFPFKVLVQPNQFSPEFIQAIINGKVKDGDKVEVEMEEKGEYCKECTCPTPCYNLYIKLRKDNTAIIYLLKESVEDAAFNYAKDRMSPDLVEDAFIAGAKWNESNKL